MMDKKNFRVTPAARVASFILKIRFPILAFFAVACVLCVLTMGKVKLNEDITAYLPANTETRRGVDIMHEEFRTYGTASVMISGVSYDEAKEIADEIEGTEHVALVTFDGTEDHYKGSDALISVTFDAGAGEESSVSALDEIKGIVEGRDTYVKSDVGSNYSKTLESEMTGVLLISALVILLVLTLTSRSFFELPVFGVVFIVSAALNMGTNCIFGTISSITNSVAVILQLALAIDYAIIFSRRYQDESKLLGGREAIVPALAESIIEIASSSLTTISGLAALTLMQFTLGRDLGLVLGKGIICSMITVIFFMPCIISLTPRAMSALEHKPFIPDVTRWGRHIVRRGAVFVIIFALILPLAAYFSFTTEYAFSDSSITALVTSPSRAASKKIDETFRPSTAVALLVPSGDPEAERKIAERVGELEGVKTVTTLASVRITDLTEKFIPPEYQSLLNISEDAYVTDKVTPGEVKAALNVPELDEGMIDALFKFCAQEHRDNISEAEVPVCVLAKFALKYADMGLVKLPIDIPKDQISSMRKKVEMLNSQFMGDKYDRIVITSSLPPEGEESVALVSKIGDAAREQAGDGVLVIGDITNARDLAQSYKTDSVLISILTAAFVFVILLLTFGSPVAALILVFVIQGSIWINFAIPTLLGIKCSFMTQVIVSAIQMGATIDYAIVFFSHYRAHRKTEDKREAASLAIRDSFKTVITSGAIMAFAGLLIAFRISDVYVGHMGFAVGRGAAISSLAVLTVLPSLIVFFDGAITKTTFRKNKKTAEKAVTQ